VYAKNWIQIKNLTKILAQNWPISENERNLANFPDFVVNVLVSSI
jgi:hypothetical protein